MKTAGRPWQYVLPEPFAIHLIDVYIRWMHVSDGCPSGRSLSCGRGCILWEKQGEKSTDAVKEEMKMIQVSCSQVKKYYGAQLVLENITFEVQEGERVAIIGKNGSGKSTVLKLITRQEMPDEGTISIRKNAVTGYLEQMPEYSKGMTVKQVCRLAFEKLDGLREEMKRLERQMEALAEEGTLSEENARHMDEVLKRYMALQTKYETEGGYETQDRFARICTGLKLSERFLEAEFDRLSGGEKTLVCLAKTLLQQPDLLILDEPTNHLDMSMLQWLEEYLKAYRGTVLLVSHDRCFLDAVASRTLEVENGVVEEYLGNYSYYLEEKERRMQLWQDAYKEQQKQIKSMEKAIKDMRIWAAQGDNEKMFQRAASMQKRLDRMEKVERPKKEGPGMRVAFSQGERSVKDVLRLEGVSKRFGEKQLFRNLTMDVRYKEHVALLGRNGCGKTTLLRMVLGEIPADEGILKLGGSVTVGYLPQQVHFPKEDVSVLEAFRDGLVIGEGKAREELARYLFTGENVFKKVANLSGGEKSRLYLAKLMQTGIYTPQNASNSSVGGNDENSGKINFLILDEPTNHLDIISRENLENALEQFEGTLLIVSHDRYFLNKMATRIVEMTENGVYSYQGNYEDYRHEKAKMEASGSSGNDAAEKSSRSEERRTVVEAPVREPVHPAAQEEKRGGKNQFRQRQLEQEIKTLEEEKRRYEEELAAAGSDYEKLMEMEGRKKKTERKIEEKLEEWLLLTES